MEKNRKDNNRTNLNGCLWPIAENVINVSLVMNGDEETTRASKRNAVLLTRQTDCGRVDDGHELFEIVYEYFVEEFLVSILVL